MEYDGAYRIPFLSVEEIMDKLTSENIVEHSSDKRKKYTSEVEVKVNQVYKPVHVAIGEQKMTMSEIEQIEEGDIIHFIRKFRMNYLVM